MDNLSQVCDATEYGINMLNGRYAISPTFVLSFTKNNKIPWNDGDRTYPDQIKAFANSAFKSSSKTILMESEADYDRVYSASVSAEYSGVAFSATASSDFMYHGNLFTSDSTTYGLDYRVQRLCYFNRSTSIHQQNLTDDFVSSIQALPEDITSQDNQDVYRDFFENYGTHYLSMGSIGGSYYMETSIADSVFKNKTEEEIKIAVSMGYQGLVSSGKFSAEAAYKASDFLNQHRNEISIGIEILGGTYAPNKDITAWVTSLYQYPTVILGIPSSTDTLGSTLRSISRLAVIAGASTTIKANIETLIRKFTSSAQDSTGLITDRKDAPLNTVAHAPLGCGFISSTVASRNNGDRGWVRCYLGSTVNPTQEVAAASQHFYTDHDDMIPYSSLLTPLPMGQNYKLTTQATAGNPAFSANFFGFGTDTVPALGAMVTKAVNIDYVAETDGLLCGVLDINHNGDRGYLLAQVNGTMRAGCSVHQYDDSDHYFPCNSFTLPIRAGEHYKVVYFPTCNQPTAKVNFVPITAPNVKLQPAQQLSPGTNYTATLDGFVVCYLDADQNGERGYLTLTTQPQGGGASSLSASASTAVHAYTGSDTWIRYNTATLPVAKGDTYSCAYTPTCGYPSLNIYWYGMATTPTRSISMIATGLSHHFISDEPRDDQHPVSHHASHKQTEPANS